MKVRIKSIEYYLPPKIENGNSLIKDNPDWCIEDIEKKTGIKTRHISAPGQTVTDMAALASEKLFDSGVDKKSIDSIILVTQSPDYVLPTSSCILQDRLGLTKACVAYDVNLGCSGFIYALAIESALIESHLINRGIIVCSEKYTQYIDKSDRTCRPLFSDGASALLVEPCEDDNIGPFELGTDGSGFGNLIVTVDKTQTAETGMPRNRLYMDGAKVFMFTMDRVPKCANALLDKSGKTFDDIDLFIFHQASKFVLDNIVRRLKLPEEKVFVNYPQVGNTVSASIPIALKDAINEGRVKRGDQIMLVGFGVGYSWGACLVRWQ